MEETTERLVQSNEGVSSTRTEAEIQSSFPPNTSFVNTAESPCIDGPPVLEGVSQDQAMGDDQVQELSVPGAERETAPAGYENVPKELWPDADGKPPQLTERLMRSLRGKYFTVKHPLLTECGHKLDMINEPATNCDNCWFQWFNTHGELVQTTDQFYRTHGKKALIGMRGKKYVKNFGRFMVTVLAMKKEEEDEQSGIQQAVVSEQSGADTPRVGSGLSLETSDCETMPNTTFE